MTYTHTYVTMDVSAAAHEEIKQKLVAAGYEDALHDGGATLDMHGIALTLPPLGGRTVDQSEKLPDDCISVLALVRYEPDSWLGSGETTFRWDVAYLDGERWYRGFAGERIEGVVVKWVHLPAEEV